MPASIVILFIFSCLGLLFILFRPRRTKYVRRITRSYNGRARGQEQSPY